jgi:type IV secretory pathway VirJ component
MTHRARTMAAAITLVFGALVSPIAAQKSSHTRADDDVSALPLHVIATKNGSPGGLAIVLSGDGGWAGIDKQIGDYFAARGVGVVGLDSRSYLMNGRTPDEASADIARVIRHYTAQWSAQRVVLVGYSRGADMAPFIANRLPAGLREAIALIALLGPAERANFHFHWADLLSETSKPSDPPILPELERLRGTPVLCVYGKDEKESLCRLADTSAVRVDRRDGRHHFDGDYNAIASEILRLFESLDGNGR